MAVFFIDENQLFECLQSLQLNVLVDNLMVLIKVDIMKKLVFIIFILFTYNSVYSQEIDSITSQSKEEMYDFHFEKHKKQKKTGLILLGSGLVASGAGLLIAANSNIFSDDGGFGTGAGLVLAGSVTTLVSIPYLISSGSNKRKAAAYVQIGEHQQIELILPNSKIVSVGVKLEF